MTRYSLRKSRSENKEDNEQDTYSEANQEDDIVCRVVMSNRVENDALCGTVIITSVSDTVIQLAIIELTGTAECKWKSEKTIMKCPKLIMKGTEFSSKEDFYYSRHTLCGGEIPHKHKGSETFHFSCGWPTRLPCSWEGDFGLIRYMAKVTVHENQSVYVHMQEIEVLYYRDLTLEQHLLHESRVDVHRTFHFAISHLGSLDVSVWVPISGIAAGQSIPVLCTVINNSKLHFSGVLFMLTQIEIFKSTKPLEHVKKVRTDICRVARMTHIHKGKHEFYTVLRTEPKTPPTSQFYKCQTIQIIYEIWVSVQGAFSKYSGLGFSETHTPGIPIIIGTEALRFYNAQTITARVMEKLITTRAPVFMDILPPDEEVEELLHNADEELDEATILNLTRQMQENEASMSKKISEHDSNSEASITLI